MDELLRHCVREISFDGDLGSDVSRLKDFIVDFYTQANTLGSQHLDDALCSFVWSMLVQQPDILVGTVPEGVTYNVWIAPQQSAKRKGQVRDESDSVPPRLDTIANFKDVPLPVLLTQHGDRLRIAASPDSIFAATTGSHIRSSKLSPMVYSALQIITRGRDAGVSAVDLGQQSGYDQKTCFYLIKQLSELDLIVKVRRGGVGTHFCIHKYFFDRNPSWKAIRDEEREAETRTTTQEDLDMEETDAHQETQDLNFTPIDARHLSSLPLISGRLIKLLKASQNSMHASSNILITLGFSSPTKTDRRFFQSRVREMIQQGIVEKVAVPSGKGKTIKCLRLVQGDRPRGLVSALDPDDDMDDNETCNGLKFNLSIHAQILDLLDNSGTTGMTLNDLSASLQQFDKRTIELFMVRADKSHPPDHLSDLRIAGLMETNGRERRHRYFTLLNYQKLVSQEALDQSSAGYDETVKNGVGGFFPQDAGAFYEDDAALATYQDSFNIDDGTRLAKKSKKRKFKNPMLPDGTVKKGRPTKKHQQLLKANAVASSSQLVEVFDEEPPPKRKRGRPLKTSLSAVVAPVTEHVQEPALPSRSEPLAEGRQGDQPLQPTLQAKDSDPSPPHDPPPPVSSAEPLLTPTALEPLPEPEPETHVPVEPVDQQISRKANTSSARVNVSHLRRENEMMKLIENAGGIMNIQTKEFFDAHTQLLNALVAAGEPTSAPAQTRTDKRTVTFTFDSLERKGRIKQLRTSVATHTGAMKPATIVYVPDIDQEKFHDFLNGLSRHPQPSPLTAASYITIDEPLEFGTKGPARTRSRLPLQLLQLERGEDEDKKTRKNLKQANELFTYDNTTIRHVLLHERTTLAQLFGFRVAKVLRCRHLHLSALKAFESDTSSSALISRRHKIFDISYLCHDLSLELYCSLVSVLEYTDEFAAFFSTEEGRRTIVRDLPQQLHAQLQIGRSRSRSRFLDMLDTLVSLNLVVPLQPSTSETPSIACEDAIGSQIAFDPWQGQWSSVNPLAAPVFWQFQDAGPIYAWSILDGPPPLWKVVPTSSSTDAAAYWRELERACTAIPASLEGLDASFSAQGPSTVVHARSLRRSASWQSKYFFTWYQIQYLKHSISFPSTCTPLEIEDEEERTRQLNDICYITSAPLEAVIDWFKDHRDKILAGFERSKEREAKRQKKKPDGERTAGWAKKAEQARAQRENEWKDMILRVHPEPLPEASSIRVERVHNRFLQAGTVQDLSRWEKEIQEALKESELASLQAFRISGRRPLQPHHLQLRTESGSGQATPVSGPTVQELIERQGPPLVAPAPQSKKRKKRDSKDDKSEEPKKITRRHRFHWTNDFDELAKDASAIIRARCRHLPRLEWAAFEQVFPAVPRNTVRQRLATLKEIPGNEAYLRRLEDAWHELWVKHRGTTELPDADEESASNFDLQKHVEFLRAHIDKNALRVGQPQVTETPLAVLPATVDCLEETFQVLESEPGSLEWEFMWNALIEEGRDRKLKSKSITLGSEDSALLVETMSDEDTLAEAAIKMAMGSPIESYDSKNASNLLKSRSGEAIDKGIKSMLLRGVLSKCQRDPTKPRPGRQFKISESNQNIIGGPITRDTFQDAVSLLEEVATNSAGWHEWPLTATDGDCAALVQLVSDNCVEFKVDTSGPRACRPAVDWNSKKADDDQIETAISVQYHLSGPDDPIEGGAIEELVTDDTVPAIPPGHGYALDGTPAGCRLFAPSTLVDCVACLHDSWQEFLPTLDEEQGRAAHWIVDVVNQNGPSGVSKSALLELSPFPPECLTAVVNKMSFLRNPPVLWVGYQTPSLVSARHISAWSVTTGTEPLCRVFPRRWLDIAGQKVASHWNAALRAVVGVVLFRPGISQSEICYRLRPVYDRQEVQEVLRYLQSCGQLSRRLVRGNSWTKVDTVAPLDVEEEGCAFWLIGDSHWYQM